MVQRKRATCVTSRNDIETVNSASYGWMTSYVVVAPTASGGSGGSGGGGGSGSGGGGGGGHWL